MFGYLYAAIARRMGRGGIHMWNLAHHFECRGWGIGDLLAAPDDVLLQAKGFGPKSLQHWRSVIPAPITDRDRADQWRVHAEMVAGG